MRSKNLFSASVLLLPSTLVLLLYSWIGTYNRFIGDDFCSYYDAKRLSLLRYIWFWYITWGGRYSAIATDKVLVLLGAKGVRYAPFLNLLIWGIVLTLMFQWLWREKTSKGAGMIHAAALSVMMLFTMIAITPKFQQVFYWWNGMRTYTPALIVFSFHIAFLLWAKEKLHTRNHILLGSLFSFMLALFSGGYNETFTPVQFLSFAGVTGLALLSKKIRFKDKSSYFLLAAIVGSLAAMTILMVSPGAVNRQGWFPSHPGIVDMFHITLTGYLQYLGSIFFDGGKVPAVVGTALAAVWIGSQSNTKTASGWMALISFLAGISLSCASLLPSAYALAEMPAARTYIVPTYFLVFGILYSGLLLGESVSHARLLSSPYGQPILMMVITVVLLFSTITNGKALYDDRERYIKFAQLWDQTDSFIIPQAKLNGDRSVMIPAMDNWAGIERPTPSKKYWPNVCYSLYYRIQIYGPPYD